MNFVSSKNKHLVTCKLMGSAFELIVVEADERRARTLLNLGIEEIQRIESLLTEFRDDSFTAQINRFAGQHLVQVDEEVFHLLERCQRLSAITQGAFDITVGPLKKLYNFKKAQFTFPSEQQIQQTLRSVGYSYLQLDSENSSVFLSKPAMHMSFAAIGKGYAADRVKQLWLAQDLESGVINASGDLTAFGPGPSGQPWALSIRHPDHEDQILFSIPVDHASIATSGDYEQYFIREGIRYSHNLNPKTGWPIRGIKSVSVLSPSAELSDALATAVYVMGIDTGIHFIDQLPDTHCILIDDQNQAHFSKNIQTNYEN